MYVDVECVYMQHNWPLLVFTCPEHVLENSEGIWLPLSGSPRDNLGIPSESSFGSGWKLHVPPIGKSWEWFYAILHISPPKKHVFVGLQVTVNQQFFMMYTCGIHFKPGGWFQPRCDFEVSLCNLPMILPPCGDMLKQLLSIIWT